MKYIKTILYITIAIIFTACSNTKYLTDEQQLYVGADIHIKSTQKISHKQTKRLKTELNDLLRPKPNSKILGIRFKLWVYNIAGKPTGKGLRYWLKNKVGEPPVLASMSTFEKNRAVLQNRLENKGYFRDSVTVDTASKNKKLSVTYTANIEAQYTIHQISFPSDSSALSKEMQKTIKRSLLKAGQPYDLDVIKEERQRIDNRLKQKGFFYFNPDYLIVDIDSTIGNHQVDMFVKIKPQTPQQAKEIYKIKDINVFADYDINSDTSLSQKGITQFKGYMIIDPDQKFKPSIFDRTLIFKPGDVYNRNDHNLALNRLTTLGVFKFVKAQFERADTAQGNFLNAFYYLTPTEKKSIRLEVAGLTKSNNATGGQVSLNWRNRNFFKGAELFTASLYGGLEHQIAGQQNISTKRLGIDLNLFLPRIIAPFKFQTNSNFVPKTKINLGYELFNKTSQYTLNSFKGSFGYIWKEDVHKEHQLNIISINYVKPLRITNEFQQQLDTNITLARSIERQFIIGSTYNYNYNTQAKPNRKLHNFYFNGNFDLSGNLLALVTGANINKGKEIKIFNTPFSQYIRTEADFRHYLRISNNTILASRLIGGIAYAYGNSNNMPFVKEFFAGGTNDIRAFRARSLGPGSYYAGTAASNIFLADQPGDVKLELNTELRAKLFSIVRGAIFIDVGNVWTLRNDIQRPESKFTKNFMQQIAVGTGLGLRFDIKILVLRLDLAFPIRKPYLPEGSRWVFNKIDLSNKQWRKENLVFNLAIGYPF